MKQETRYKKLTKARKILGISEEVTLNEIRHSFHDLIRRWHPDKSNDKNDEHKEKSRRIINAYRIIMEYCREYKISFSKEIVDNDSIELAYVKFNCIVMQPYFYGVSLLQGISLGFVALHIYHISFHRNQDIRNTQVM